MNRPLMTFTPGQPEKGTRWGQMCCPWVCVFCCWCGGCKGAVLCWSWSMCGWVCPSFFPRRYRDLALSIWVTPPWVICHLAGLQSPLTRGTRCPCGTPRLSRKLQITFLEDFFCTVISEKALGMYLTDYSPSPWSPHTNG